MELCIDKNQCCGCGACATVCPKNAITLTEDETGFVYPVIDQGLCVNCGKCKRVCTFLEPKLGQMTQDVYLARHKDNEVLRGSTSGGMFTAISDVVLNLGGILYAPAIAENMSIGHTRITTKEKRDQARGSKYVQSRMDGVYNPVIEDLKQGHCVAFFGTPCQIGALKAAVPQEYVDRLYTVDVICNGVGSPLAWRKYVQELEKKHHRKLSAYVFRPKTNRYLTTSELCVFTDGTQVSVEHPPYKYNSWYHKGLINRPSCSNCRYADKKRVSDITIGDFSKASQLFPEFDSVLGASTLIINSEKGKELFKAFQNAITYLQVDYAACEQVRLKQCATFNPESTAFLQNCGKYGFRKSVKRHLGTVKVLKLFAYRCLQKIIKG